MRRIGALVMILMLTSIIAAGCEDDSNDTQMTGLELRFSDCLTFGIWVFIDGEYQGMASSEEPKVFSLGAGTYEFYARSNAKLGDTYFCWNESVSVSDGNITILRLSCDGAECSDE